MLEQNITTKQDLMKLIQSVQIKKIIASDVHTNEDIKDMCRTAEQFLRSNKNATVFVISI